MSRVNVNNAVGNQTLEPAPPELRALFEELEKVCAILQASETDLQVLYDKLFGQQLCTSVDPSPVTEPGICGELKFIAEALRIRAHEISFRVNRLNRLI